MVANETLMQFQADILGVAVVRPVVAETTALGAAYAAGLAVGFWDGEQDVIDNWAEDKRWTPDDGRGRARPPLPQLEEGRHQDLRLGRRRRQGVILPLTLSRRGAGEPAPFSRPRGAPAPVLRLTTCALAQASWTRLRYLWAPALQRRRRDSPQARRDGQATGS